MDRVANSRTARDGVSKYSDLCEKISNGKFRRWRCWNKWDLSLLIGLSLVNLSPRPREFMHRLTLCGGCFSQPYVLDNTTRSRRDKVENVIFLTKKGRLAYGSPIPPSSYDLLYSTRVV